MPRSRTVETRVTEHPSISNGVVGSWCCRRVVAHHNTSVLSGLGWSRLDRIHDIAAWTHSEIFVVNAGTVIGSHEPLTVCFYTCLYLFSWLILFLFVISRLINRDCHFAHICSVRSSSLESLLKFTNFFAKRRLQFVLHVRNNCDFAQTSRLWSMTANSYCILYRILSSSFWTNLYIYTGMKYIKKHQSYIRLVWKRQGSHKQKQEDVVRQ